MKIRLGKLLFQKGKITGYRMLCSTPKSLEQWADQDHQLYIITTSVTFGVFLIFGSIYGDWLSKWTEDLLLKTSGKNWNFPWLVCCVRDNGQIKIINCINTFFVTFYDFLPIWLCIWWLNKLNTTWDLMLKTLGKNEILLGFFF